jgi:hypothetical protein
MASNPFINNFSAANEQDLVENLVVEAIRFYAHDMEYLPRNGINRDSIFNENEYSTFVSHYPVEAYIKNFDSFGGDGNFLSKFGLEIRDQMVLQMSVRSFNEFVASETGATRPKEGDLIFLPMLNTVFEIKYVENAAIFYQLGKIQSYEMTCEVFEYSNEVFATGLPLDDIYNAYSTIPSIDNDPFNQNEDIEELADTILDDVEDSPFGDF